MIRPMGVCVREKPKPISDQRAIGAARCVANGIIDTPVTVEAPSTWQCGLQIGSAPVFQCPAAHFQSRLRRPHCMVEFRRYACCGGTNTIFPIWRFS